MSNILIVDENDVARKGLQALLALEMQYARIETAWSARETTARLNEDLWDLIITELQMPDSSGLETIADIKVRNAKCAVLVFSGCSESELGVRAIQSGADGFVKKTALASELFEAIRTVLGGNRYLSPELAQCLEEANARPKHTGLHALSNRELYVLRRIGQGRTISEIAEEMGLSVKTVSTYRSPVLEKLHLHTTAELVRFALENKLSI